MSERVLDGTVKIYETPGSRRIRYRFKVPDDLEEPYADLRILTGGGFDNPDIRRVKVEIRPKGSDKWENITDDCVTDPPNGEDSTNYKIVFPERLEKGTRLRITIIFDDEFESGEYIVFRPSFDDESVLSAVQDTPTPSVGEFAVAIFKREAQTLVVREMLEGRSTLISDRALAALVRRCGVKAILERLATVSPDFQEILLRLDALEQNKPVKISRKRGKSKGGRR
jgi:hypothetical protein